MRTLRSREEIVNIHTTEILARLAREPGMVLVYALGASHRSDHKLKTSCLLLRRADGSDALVIPDPAGKAKLDDLVRQYYVYEGAPLNAEFERQYWLTPDGLKRGQHATTLEPIR
jgi:hypothetical protein